MRYSSAVNFPSSLPSTVKRPTSFTPDICSENFLNISSRVGAASFGLGSSAEALPVVADKNSASTVAKAHRKVRIPDELIVRIASRSIRKLSRFAQRRFDFCGHSFRGDSKMLVQHAGGGRGTETRHPDESSLGSQIAFPTHA